MGIDNEVISNSYKLRHVSNIFMPKGYEQHLQFKPAPLLLAGMIVQCNLAPLVFNALATFVMPFCQFGFYLVRN